MPVDLFQQFYMEQSTSTRSHFPSICHVTSVLLQKQWLQLRQNFNLRHFTYAKMDAAFVFFLVCSHLFILHGLCK